MSRELKEHDVVTLARAVDTREAGERGTIVYVAKGGGFLVEFGGKGDMTEVVASDLVEG